MKGKFLNNYWKYYLVLEEDFLKTLRYVSLDRDNFITFSTEYTKQYQTICSEIDVICKEICDIIKPGSKPSTIVQYAEIILKEIGTIKADRVTVKNYGAIDLYPWSLWQLKDGFSEYKSPSWWTNYNGVKHNRSLNFKEAKLENVLNALAALYVLEMYCYDCIKEDSPYPPFPLPRSELFTLNDWKGKGIERRLLGEVDGTY